MEKKYIIKLEDNNLAYTAIMIDGVPYIKPLQLLPYTEPDMEQVRKEAYEQGRKDGKIEGRAEVWVVARDIDHMSDDDIKACFECGFSGVFEKYTASEAIEKIRQYEQEKKESEEPKEEQSVTAEDVMRQYLDTFCKRNFCTKCLLHTPDFTCGRGYHFLTKNPVSDEEVRRAYAKVVKE